MLENEKNKRLIIYIYKYENNCVLKTTIFHIAGYTNHMFYIILLTVYILLTPNAM